MPTPAYNAICLIANPNSTRGGHKVAKDLAKLLRGAVSAPVDIELTKRPGHATEIVKRRLDKDPLTLLISVSGDGGYHEVVNGAMDSAVLRPLCTVFAAGNSNDHHKFVYESGEEFVARIAAGNPRPLDLIRFQSRRGKQSTDRYAHSYGGLGISAIGAKRTEEHDKGPVSEFGLAMAVTAKAQPVSICFGRRCQPYDSLLFFNIGRMAKYLKTRQRHAAGDGTIGMVRIRHSSRYRRFWLLAQAATVGLQTRRVTSIRFLVKEPALLQLDGEIYDLAAETECTVSRQAAALRTF